MLITCEQEQEPFLMMRITKVRINAKKKNNKKKKAGMERTIFYRMVWKSFRCHIFESLFTITKSRTNAIYFPIFPFFCLLKRKKKKRTHTISIVLFLCWEIRSCFSFIFFSFLLGEKIVFVVAIHVNTQNVRLDACSREWTKKNYRIERAIHVWMLSFVTANDRQSQKEWNKKRKCERGFFFVDNNENLEPFRLNSLPIVYHPLNKHFFLSFSFKKKTKLGFSFIFFHIWQKHTQKKVFFLQNYLTNSVFLCVDTCSFVIASIDMDMLQMSRRKNSIFF